MDSLHEFSMNQTFPVWHHDDSTPLFDGLKINNTVQQILKASGRIGA